MTDTTASSAVRRLTLTDFRSYAFARLDVSPMPVVLTGPNGAGKTNLLEAVSLLVPGRGFRRAAAADLTRHAGTGAWGIAAKADTPRGAVEIGTGNDPAGATGGTRRLVRIDGQPARSQAALADFLQAVWLIPQMDRLFLEGASERRRFLDRLVYGLDLDHARRVSAYENAMRQRSRLLREGPRDAVWLRTLEEQMASLGVAIAVARRGFADRHNAVAPWAAGGFPAARISPDGTVEKWLDTMAEPDAVERLGRALADSRGRDGDAGGAGVGPHRSEMQVFDAARNVPAGQCSTGEQKALLISLVLTSARMQTAERGAPPLILLDEVAAHLDAGRRARLFEEISALQAQAWITGTDIDLFTPFGAGAQFFSVQESALIPI